MNPLEKINTDRRLQAILNGLTSIWHYPEDFLAIVLYHADEFDIAEETIELYNQTEMGLEECLFSAMTLGEFKERCLYSDYLNKDKCKELFENGKQ